MSRLRPGGSIDSFGTFLRKLNAAHAVTKGAGGEPRRASGKSEEEGVRRLVCELAARGPLPVAELMAESGLGFTEFSTALTAAAQSEMVRLVEQGTGEVAELTPWGVRLAKLVT